MGSDLRTQGDVLWRVASITAMAVGCSAGMTVAALFAVFGSDPGRLVPVSTFFWAALIMATLSPALICPLLVYRSVLAMRDLTLARDSLDDLARTDQLTDLLNRRGFDQAAAAAIVARSAIGSPLAVLLCDIDHFKQINDAWGHAFGDAVLRATAGWLRAAMPGSILGRQGGDEFVALLVGVPYAEALAKAEHLKRCCAAGPVMVEGASVDVTLSIGLAAVSSFDGDLAASIAATDRALYAAKQGGRNRVAIAWNGFQAAE